MTNTNNVVHVQMLGQFSVSIGDHSINSKTNQAKKPWSILQYLITFRDRDVATGELIDLIWSDDHSTNPGGALKTLVFRSRKLLEPLGVPPQDLVIQKRGSYAWNPEYKILSDADAFESLCLQAAADGVAKEEQLQLSLQAIDLYKGDFLPRSSWESWTAPIRARYHSMYLQTVHKTIGLLTSAGDWDEIARLCENAIRIEPFDEDLHYSLIYALHSSGKKILAQEYYKRTIDLFYNEFSITPSERLKDLYKIIRDEEHGVTTDLSIIQESLQEQQKAGGAYYCEYSVFRDIYQLEQRTIERTGDSVYLCLLTVRTAGGELPKTSVMVRAMDSLGRSISRSLRRGDVYARYSLAQYIILLPTASYENGCSVMKRIISTFRKEYTRKDLVIDYSLQSVLLRQTGTI